MIKCKAIPEPHSVGLDQRVPSRCLFSRLHHMNSGSHVIVYLDKVTYIPKHVARASENRKRIVTRVSK